MEKLLIVVALLAGSHAAPAQEWWQTQTKKDKMTGELSAYAHSPSVKPSAPMRFPYADVRAWLGIGCDAESEWAYIGFSEAPNLRNTSTQDGYNIIRARVKWDDAVHTARLTQEWGDHFLGFVEDRDEIARIATAARGLIELDWYGSGDVYFQFSLNGSAAALEEIRAFCGGSIGPDQAEAAKLCERLDRC